MYDLETIYFDDKLDEEKEEEILKNLRSLPLQKWPRYTDDGWNTNRHMQLQVFPKFSGIESLVLESFSDSKLLSSALKLIGNLPVKRLEIRYDHSDDDYSQMKFP